MLDKPKLHLTQWGRNTLPGMIIINLTLILMNVVFGKWQAVIGCLVGGILSVAVLLALSLRRVKPAEPPPMTEK